MNEKYTDINNPIRVSGTIQCRSTITDLQYSDTQKQYAMYDRVARFDIILNHTNLPQTVPFRYYFSYTIQCIQCHMMHKYIL